MRGDGGGLLIGAVDRVDVCIEIDRRAEDRTCRQLISIVAPAALRSSHAALTIQPRTWH
jgi:hypothetical protein